MVSVFDHNATLRCAPRCRGSGRSLSSGRRDSTSCSTNSTGMAVLVLVLVVAAATAGAGAEQQ